MKKVLGWILIVVCSAVACVTLSGCKHEEIGYTRYEITAEYIPENRTLTGMAKVTFENNTDNEISVLKFQIYPNAYRQDALYKPISSAYTQSAYYVGESYGEMVVSSVHGSKNWEVMGEDENILYAYHHMILQSFPIPYFLDCHSESKIRNLKTFDLEYFQSLPAIELA